MDFGNDVERIALDLIERFGELAVPVARELATVSDWSVCFVFCAPFSRPLLLTWPLTDCSKRCHMQCLYDNADGGSAEQKTFRSFGADVGHISCKLVEIVNQRQHDPHSVQTWRNIADAIEKLSSNLRKP
jgi:hypothetical protein